LIHGDSPYAELCYEQGWQTCKTAEALLAVFGADVQKLYDFLEPTCVTPWRGSAISG